MKRGILAMALLALTATAWAQSNPPSVSSSASPQSQAPARPESPSQEPAPVAPSSPPSSYSVMMKFGDASIDKPWAEGQKALEERRWFKPAGNNAAEYYLQAQAAVLQQTKVNPHYAEATQEALRSLFPYVLAAAEAAIERNDKSEADRLISLLEKMDPTAPAVQRLNEVVNAAPAQKPN